MTTDALDIPAVACREFQSHPICIMVCARCWHRQDEHKHPLDVEPQPASRGAVETPAQEPKGQPEMDDLKYLDVEQNPPVGSAFHWRDGWFFQRTKLGAVLVTVPNGQGQKVIPPNEWASIVAHVSRQGENGESFKQALDFHGETA